MGYKAYDVKVKRKVDIKKPKLVKFKNGRYAISGTSSVSGNKVSLIISTDKAKEIKKNGL